MTTGGDDHGGGDHDHLMMGMIIMMIIFRGYNRSGQPEGIGNYALEHLVEDVRGLVKVRPLRYTGKYRYTGIELKYRYRDF